MSRAVLITPYPLPQIKKQHEARLEQDLEQKKQHLEELRQRKEHNDVSASQCRLSCCSAGLLTRAPVVYPMLRPLRTAYAPNRN